MSILEIKLRVHFELRSVEPLTAAQIAQRIDANPGSVQNKLNELLAEGYIKRRRTEQCNRPYVYQRADRPWPEDIVAQECRQVLQRMAARAMQH